MTSPPHSIATRLARVAFEAESQVQEPSLIREGPRSRVFRVEIATSGATVTAVLKQITDAGECGFTDWASLAWLEESGAGLVPRFLAGDLANRCFLMEDLGSSRTLDTLLQGSDPAASVAALEALSVCYARLHSLPVDEREWQWIRGSLPAAEGLGRAAEAERWLAGAGKLKAWAEAAGMSGGTITHTAVRPVGRIFRDPGLFLAFTHGDPAPSNNHLSPTGVRLVDFEYGGFRHALYDLTAWYILCPLPEPVVERMCAAYRAELVRAGSALAAAPFDPGWAEMCAYRALAMLTWVSPQVLEQNRSWVGDWTAREALLVALRRMANTAAPHPHLEPLAAFAGELLTHLETRWPEYGQSELRFPGLTPAIPASS